METKTQIPVAKFTEFNKDSNWCNGTCGGYWFEAKVYDEGSEYGINGGRVSKLHVTLDGKDVVAYDRGWCPGGRGRGHRQALLAILSLLETSPKRFE